jgi:hypothetical protein
MGDSTIKYYRNFDAEIRNMHRNNSQNGRNNKSNDEIAVCVQTLTCVAGSVLMRPLSRLTICRVRVSCERHSLASSVATQKSPATLAAGWTPSVVLRTALTALCATLRTFGAEWVTNAKRALRPSLAAVPLQTCASWARRTAPTLTRSWKKFHYYFSFFYS